MKKLAITLTAIATMLMSGSDANANDLIKALSVLQGANRGVSYGHRSPGRTVTVQKTRVTTRDRAEAILRAERIAKLKRLERLKRERSRQHVNVGFRVGVQVNRPVLPAPQVITPRPVVVPHVPVLPPAPVYVEPAPVLPPSPRHSCGDIVTCEVPLHKRVVYRDRGHIARNARPVTVAVRTPNGHADQVSYVTVMAPPCEPQFVKVSPCGRRIRMDYGKYEVNITSRPNVIKVDYDN